MYYRVELVEVRPSVLMHSLSCCRVFLHEVRLRKRLNQIKIDVRKYVCEKIGVYELYGFLSGEIK